FVVRLYSFLIFFFNDTATTEIYTLSLHDALPIYEGSVSSAFRNASAASEYCRRAKWASPLPTCSRADAGNFCVPSRKASIAASKDRKSTRLNSSHRTISYAVFCLKKKKNNKIKYK